MDSATADHAGLAILPSDNARYGTRDYWDERYSTCDQPFDWFKRWEDLKQELLPLIHSPSSRILMLGCGNSTLSADMYHDGLKHIVNIDYSQACISQMSSLHADKPEMEWIEGDVRHLPFEDDSFDVAIDKGTMDAMMTAKHDVWNPPADMLADCKAEVAEALRVLKPDGVFIYVTFAQPHFRKKILATSGYDLTVKEIGDGFAYYIFTLKRSSTPTPIPSS